MNIDKAIKGYEKLLGELKYKDTSGRSGVSKEGYAYAEVPDWLLRRQLGIIKSLRSQLSSQWVSVKDRLPEAKEQESGEYYLDSDILLYLASDKIILGNYYCDSLMGLMEFVVSNNDCFDDLHDEVTHWQPLPAPPKD